MIDNKPATVAVPVEHAYFLNRLEYARKRLALAIELGYPKHIKRCANRVEALRVKVEATE